MILMSRLAKLYESQGFQVRTSLTPFLVGRGWNIDLDLDVSITQILKNGKLASPNAGGIHQSEVGFVQDLGRILPRKSILVVGNSFGWSTFAFLLSNPGSQVVAIDACVDPRSREGTELTNIISRKEGFNVEAVVGRSPEDIEQIVLKKLSNPPDLCFIDGEHTNQAQAADFMAVQKVASDDCIYLFHDVICCGLLNSFMIFPQIQPRFVAALLGRTYSGMGLLYPATYHETLAELLHAYVDPALHVQDEVLADRSVNKVIRMRLPTQSKGGTVTSNEFFGREAPER